MSEGALQSSIAVLRGYVPSEAVALATELWECGLASVEISILGEPDWACFEAVAEHAGGGRRVGVGSLRSDRDVRRAVAAGARFAISPAFSESLAAAGRQADLELIPGVLTPTEVLAALDAGFSTLKLFPAGILGPGYVQTLLAPFPEVQLIAVGGIDANNAARFLEAGAAGVGLGSALLPPPGFQAEELSTVRRSVELLSKGSLEACDRRSN